MAILINYTLMREILEELEIFYSQKAMSICDLKCTKMYEGQEIHKMLFYLNEHGYIEAQKIQEIGFNCEFQMASITAKGKDFLSPDGGLSKLNAPYIRLDIEYLRTEILSALEKKELPVEEESRIKKLLEGIEKEGMARLISKLVDEGITRTPELLKYLDGII